MKPQQRQNMQFMAYLLFYGSLNIHLRRFSDSIQSYYSSFSLDSTFTILLLRYLSTLCKYDYKSHT